MFSDTLQSARYLAFGGCGMKGVTYMGCLKALQQRPGHAEWHRRLRGTCGSSSGCLAALGFLVDVDATVAIERMQSLNVDSVVPYMDLNAIFARYGVDEGEEVRRFIREVFAACGLAYDTTFRTLHRLTNRDLRICVTNLSRRRLDIFSHLTTPDVVVSDAIYWSMTVPFVFQPETYLGDVMVDGCVLAYVPYDVWPVAETVVFYATGVNTGNQGTARQDIKDLQSFAAGVMSCCAKAVLQSVTDLSVKHPDHFLRIAFVGQARDATLKLEAGTFEALVNLGFATTFFRLHPEAALVFDRLLRVGIGLVATTTSNVGTYSGCDEADAGTEGVGGLL